MQLKKKQKATLKKAKQIKTTFVLGSVGYRANYTPYNY